MHVSIDVTNDILGDRALSITGMVSNEDLTVGCISKAIRVSVRIVLLVHAEVALSSAYLIGCLL